MAGNKAVKTYQVIEDCDHDNSEKRRRLVTNAGGTVVNLYGKQVVWTHDLRGLPSLVIGDVFVYLTTNCDWTREKYAMMLGRLKYLKSHEKDNHFSAAYLFSFFTVHVWQVLSTIYPEFLVRKTNVSSSAREIVYPGY